MSFAGTCPVLFPRARLLFTLYRHEAQSGPFSSSLRGYSRVFARSNASQCACGTGELLASTIQTIFRRPLHRHLHSPEPPARCRPTGYALTDLLTAPAACPSSGGHSACQPRTPRSTTMQQPACRRQCSPRAQCSRRPGIRHGCRAVQARQCAGAPVPGLDSVQGQVGPVHQGAPCMLPMRTYVVSRH